MTNKELGMNSVFRYSFTLGIIFSIYTRFLIHSAGLFFSTKANHPTLTLRWDLSPPRSLSPPPPPASASSPWPPAAVWTGLRLEGAPSACAS